MMFYEAGPVKTDSPWDRPTHEAFNGWLKKFIERIDIPIEVYICGNFLENPNNTWDIDIQLTSVELPPLEKLRDLMIYGKQMGHDDFNILIDMQYIFHHSFLKASKKYVLSNGIAHIKKLMICNEVYKYGERIWHRPDSLKLIDNLYQMITPYPNPKHNERLNEPGPDLRAAVLIYENF
jgi:hypothetical protein